MDIPAVPGNDMDLRERAVRSFALRQSLLHLIPFGSRFENI